MTRFIVIITIILMTITSCKNDEINNLKRSNTKLIEQLKSKNEELSLLKNSLPILFESAINIEDTNKEKAIEIYKKIYKTDSLSYWTFLSEERMLKLQSDINHDKNSLKDLFLFELNDTLSFYYNNGKCGEWGGDQEIINIYYKKGNLYANYRKYIYNCDELEKLGLKEKLQYKLIEKKNILVSIQAESIIKECILDILRHRLNNFGFVSHAGTYSTVELKEKNETPSILINYYSDIFIWSKFHKLKKELFNNKTIANTI